MFRIRCLVEDERYIDDPEVESGRSSLLLTNNWSLKISRRAGSGIHDLIIVDKDLYLGGYVSESYLDYRKFIARYTLTPPSNHSFGYSDKLARELFYKIESLDEYLAFQKVILGMGINPVPERLIPSEKEMERYAKEKETIEKILRR